MSTFCYLALFVFRASVIFSGFRKDHGRLLICVFLHLGSMRRPAAPLPTVARATGNCAAVEASSPLSVTICLSHFGPRIGQTSLQLLFCPNLSLLPSTHSFPLFLGRGCNNLSPHFRWILAVWITSVYEARDDHCARGAY